MWGDTQTHTHTHKQNWRVHVRMHTNTHTHSWRVHVHSDYNILCSRKVHPTLQLFKVVYQHVYDITAVFRGNMMTNRNSLLTQPSSIATCQGMGLTSQCIIRLLWLFLLRFLPVVLLSQSRECVSWYLSHRNTTREETHTWGPCRRY